MKYAEDQNLIGFSHANLIDDNIWQPMHHPFMGTGNAASVPHARKFRQTFRRHQRSYGFRQYARALARCNAALQAA